MEEAYASAPPSHLEGRHDLAHSAPSATECQIRLADTGDLFRAHHGVWSRSGPLGRARARTIASTPRIVPLQKLLVARTARPRSAEAFAPSEGFGREFSGSSHVRRSARPRFWGDGLLVVVSSLHSSLRRVAGITQWSCRMSLQVRCKTPFRVDGSDGCRALLFFIHSARRQTTDHRVSESHPPRAASVDRGFRVVWPDTTLVIICFVTGLV